MPRQRLVGNSNLSTFDLYFQWIFFYRPAVVGRVWFLDVLGDVARSLLVCCYLAMAGVPWKGRGLGIITHPNLHLAEDCNSMMLCSSVCLLGVFSGND